MELFIYQSNRVIEKEDISIEDLQKIEKIDVDTFMLEESISALK